MKLVIWLLAIAVIAAFAYALVKSRRRRAELARTAEQRAAAFMAEAMAAKSKATPQVAPQADAAELAKQRLLLDAAAKAGEAGEPVLSIQLYARLLARYPESAFASQARAAVEAQKKNLAKA